ncbi:MAG TPA: NAD(P)H-binding protein [Actinomycetota bacterium]|nr:NAD(P)H-binding protein [Actinomycetota bacterium]
MPVVVVGASGTLGRLAVAAFVGVSPEVRAVVRRREAAGPLRALGAKVAVVAPGDLETLEAVMRDAHTLCHLAGGLDLPDAGAYERANLRTVEAALAAAERARIRRFLLLSSAGADPSAPHPYLRAKGLAEEAVRASSLEHVVVRSTLVCAPGSAWLRTVRAGAGRWPALVVGSGRQVLAPVAAEDVVRVLVAADDRARVASGTWGLEGPERLTADELARRLGGGGKPRVHLGPRLARAVLRVGGRRPGRHLLELLATDSVADAPDASAEFGVERTPLERALRASLGPGPAPWT